jgi:DNA-binding NarL/FixJ family response regulator
LVVSANDDIRRGLRHVLDQGKATSVVGEAASADAAIDVAARAAADVVVFDVRRFPDVSTVTAVRAIRSANRVTRALFLVPHVNAKTMVATWIAGASGFLLKELDLAGIQRAIGCVGRGESLVDPTLGLHAVMRARRELAARGGAPFLASAHREDRVLDLIGEGLVDREIADRLDLSEADVQRLILRIYSTLHYPED